MQHSIFVAALSLFIVAALAAPTITCDPAYRYRRSDGACNNLAHPFWGVGHESFPGGVQDGILIRNGEPVEFANLTLRQSPRDLVVNPVVIGVDRVRHPTDTSPRRFASFNQLFVFLTQFLVHDIVNTEITPFNPFGANIAKQAQSEDGRTFTLGNPSFDYIDADGIPQVFNLATSYIDLSPTYGATEQITQGLRSFQDGLLLTANRTHWTFTYNNFPNMEFCNCRNTTSGQPYYVYAPDGSNAADILKLTGRGFAPEPFPPLGICISPAPSFIPGNIPGVYSCSLTAPPQRLNDIVCTINFAKLADPRYAPAAYEAQGDWQPFVSQTNPTVPFDLINAQTRDPAKAFAAGDKRNSENFAILLLQNLFLRVHNTRARALKAANPTWNDEKLFQESRKYTTAIWQNIIYGEVLPVLLGESGYARGGFRQQYRDRDYDPRVDPRISNSFTTAAFRFHSLVNKVIYPMDPSTKDRIVANKVQMNVHLFGQNNPGPEVNPYVYLLAAGQSTLFGSSEDQMALLAAMMPSGLGPDEGIMAGMVFGKAQQLDHFVEKSLADLDVNSCFTPGLFVSVPALTTFRGRNHGLPSYNYYRETYGRKRIYGRGQCPNPTDATSADPIECFQRLVFLNDNDDDNDDDSPSDVDRQALAQMLKDTYGRIDKIDPWFGLMVESEAGWREDGAVFSKTAANMAIDQFQRLKYGDRFWFENSINGFSAAELDQIRNTKLAHLLAQHFPGIAASLPPADQIFAGIREYN